MNRESVSENRIRKSEARLSVEMRSDCEDAANAQQEATLEENGHRSGPAPMPRGLRMNSAVRSEAVGSAEPNRHIREDLVA